MPDLQPDPVRRAEGVEYFELGGLDAFRCAQFRCSMSTRFCASRWREAQAARGERGEELVKCRQCRVGAAHAGERALPRALNFLNNVCCRCRRGTLRRLVLGRICVSCYNRGRERAIGRNARGNAPIKAQEELAYRTLGMVLDPGTPAEQRVEYTDVALDELELRMSIGRVHEGHIEFLGLVPYGTYRPWRPAALGGLKAIVTPPADATNAVNSPPDREAPEARQSTPRSRLRLAAMSSSCLGRIDIAPPWRLGIAGRESAPKSGTLRLAA